MTNNKSWKDRAQRKACESIASRRGNLIENALAKYVLRALAELEAGEETAKECRDALHTAVFAELKDKEEELVAAKEEIGRLKGEIENKDDVRSTTTKEDPELYYDSHVCPADDCCTLDERQAKYRHNDRCRKAGVKR